MFGWLSAGCQPVKHKPAGSLVLQEGDDFRFPEGMDEAMVKLNDAIELGRQTLHRAVEANVTEFQQQSLRRMLSNGERLFAASWVAKGGAPENQPYQLSRQQGDCCLGCMPGEDDLSRDPLGMRDMSLSEAALAIKADVQRLESTPAWAAYHGSTLPGRAASSDALDADGPRPAAQRDVVWFCLEQSGRQERRESFLRGYCRNLSLQGMREELHKLPAVLGAADPVVMHVELPVEGATLADVTEARSCLLADMMSLNGGRTCRLRLWVINAALFSSDELKLLSERASQTFVVTWEFAVSEALRSAFLPWLYGALDTLQTLSVERLGEILAEVKGKLEQLDPDGRSLHICEPKYRDNSPPPRLGLGYPPTESDPGPRLLDAFLGEIGWKEVGRDGDDLLVVGAGGDEAGGAPEPAACLEGATQATTSRELSTALEPSPRMSSPSSQAFVEPADVALEHTAGTVWKSSVSHLVLPLAGKDCRSAEQQIVLHGRGRTVLCGECAYC